MNTSTKTLASLLTAVAPGLLSCAHTPAPSQETGPVTTQAPRETAPAPTLSDADEEPEYDGASSARPRRR